MEPEVSTLGGGVVTIGTACVPYQVEAVMGDAEASTPTAVTPVSDDLPASPRPGTRSVRYEMFVFHCIVRIVVCVCVCVCVCVFLKCFLCT